MNRLRFGRLPMGLYLTLASQGAIGSMATHPVDLPPGVANLLLANTDLRRYPPALPSDCRDMTGAPMPREWCLRQAPPPSPPPPGRLHLYDPRQNMPQPMRPPTNPPPVVSPPSPVRTLPVPEPPSRREGHPMNFCIRVDVAPAGVPSRQKVTFTNGCVHAATVHWVATSLPFDCPVVSSRVLGGGESYSTDAPGNLRICYYACRTEDSWFDHASKRCMAN